MRRNTKCILHESRCFTKSYSAISKNLKKDMEKSLFLYINSHALRMLSLTRIKHLYQYIWQIQLKFSEKFLGKTHFSHFGCFHIFWKIFENLTGQNLWAMQQYCKSALFNNKHSFHHLIFNKEMLKTGKYH